jgi:POT family proton-dependent oligopeptide transporter
MTRQPRGLYLLFGVEMWERFSYYGMRAFLVLFLTSSDGGFGWSKEQASHLYGWYTGLVYLTPLLGGYLADRVLGTHKAIVIGSVVIATGHFCLAVPGRVSFFLGLSLIILGTGFHKSNISTQVGQLYQQEDPRRDAAFTIFYMGINTGAFLGPLVCGGLARSASFGWHWGFAAAGVGMVLGTAAYLLGKRRLLAGVGDAPAARPTPEAAPAPPLSREEWERIGAIGILAVFNVFFWSAFEQAGSSMNFFAEERVDRRLGGFEIPTPWFQSVNPVSIIVFAPVFAALWSRLADRGREPSTPIKFVLALVLISLGFMVLVAGAGISDSGVRVSPLWLVGAIVLHTWGELCLSPVGLSMVTRLSPARFGSLMMGLWFVSFFVSDLTAGRLAGMLERFEEGAGHASFFSIFVVVPLVGAALLLALSPLVGRLMHGRA